MTVRPFAVHLYTCNSTIMFCGSEFVTQWAVARCVLTSHNLSSLLFCFTITLLVESDVQCRTGKLAVYFTYRCYPVICLEALKATTMKPQNTVCQGWESKLVPPEQERQLITHHDLRLWLIFGLCNDCFQLGSWTTSNGGLMCE